MTIAAPPSLRIVTAADEQAWNTGQLANPVVAPQYRVWVYERSALVVGHGHRSTTLTLRIDPPTIKRDSGGGAVPVGPWLVGVSVALPPGHQLVTSNLVNSYRWFGEAHASALRCLGVRASAVPPSQLATLRVNETSSTQWACFGSLSPWEVVGSGHRKLVGLAQVRRRTGVLLVAGTLIKAPDWHAFTAFMGHSLLAADHLAEFTTDVESELGQSVPAAEFAVVLGEELRRQLLLKDT